MSNRDLITPFIEADPGFVHELEDAASLQALVDTLVEMRKASGLDQRDVARKMKVSPARVAEFESESSDPSAAMVQRYARAIGARVRLEVDYPAT